MSTTEIQESKVFPISDTDVEEETVNSMQDEYEDAYIIF